MQLEIRSKPHTVDGKKRQKIKVHATNLKDHLGGGNQDDRKRKDKFIRVSLCFSSDFHAVSKDLKATRNTSQGYRLHF